MIETVFKALVFRTKYIEVDNFINEIAEEHSNIEDAHNQVKESLIKLVLYKFISIKEKAPKGSYVFKEHNFYKAREVGSIETWLEQQRHYQEA
ncbi:hypothetical protein H3Z83_02295 [Tenacibaculum sp. S7007]|uniref:Uncharacterized protein n=1 Tax=Tenacibaculum pelagium TaxID=2759527 RepID=A0A839AMF2_9FLAO|nr:hypothetical protein [Tenacibaculum pelagium]MBA6155359.1 hypothetical protein [Tenacibaculum pelagium]